MKLHTLLRCLGPFVALSKENPDIVSIENDNRKVQPGSLFICIKGYTVDGHNFAASAIEKGAVAIIAEKELEAEVPVIVVKDTVRAMARLADTFYMQPTQQLRLIGITGTNGKTSVSHFIENIFSSIGEKTGLIGTMYTKIGQETFETKNTTPESLTLQKTFKKMVDTGVQTAVMEVSSHALHMGRVHGCDYDIAVFTNLTQDHLDYHHTMEEYKQAKGLLFSQLGNVFDYERPKYAVLNGDDEASEAYALATAAHVITYGIDSDADVRAINMTMTASGTEFTLVTPTDSYNITMKLVGKFSVYNVLASIATALVAGIAIEDIISAVESFKGVPGRFEVVDAGQDFSVIVDYAHTPDSLENVLKTVKQFANGKIFVVAGCGGDRDRTKRPLMAKIACQYATNPIFTSDNPRSEVPEQILKDMESGVIGETYETIVDRREAIAYAIGEANQGDVVLIAGKGHETYQQIGDTFFDFDDRLVAKEAIEGR